MILQRPFLQNDSVLMETYTFIDSGIEYTYYLVNRKAYLGTNSNQKSAISRETNGSLYIPSHFTSNGIKYTITVLSKYSFYHTKLKSIVVPSTIKTISWGAFEVNPYLEYLDLSNTRISTLNGYTMSRCTILETILLPITLKKIETYAFSWCNSLKEVRIPPHVSSIVNNTFFAPLEKVIFCGTKEIDGFLPESVTSIIVPLQYKSNSFCEKTQITKQAMSCDFPSQIKCSIKYNKSLFNNRIVIFIIIVISK